MKIQNRTLQKIAKFILISLCAVTLGSMMLPAVVGQDWNKALADTMFFRGYNLTEVSNCGWLASAFIATAIVLLLAKIPFHLQCISTAILGIFGWGSYIGGISAVNLYLCDVADLHMELQYGFVVTMILYLLIIVLAVLFSGISAQQPQRVVVRFNRRTKS